LEIDVQVFSLNTKKKVVKTNVTFGNVQIENQSSLSEKRFIELAGMVTDLLSKFQCEYKKALSGKLKFVFKPSSEQKAKATYKSELDEIWISNSTETLKLFTKELYGLPNWFNSSYITSKYSVSAGFADEENWAECFAIAFFGQSIHPRLYKLAKCNKQI